MKWRELEVEQKRLLDYKIDVAQGVIRQALAVSGRPCIAFSGGKDSTVLLHLVHQHMPDVHVIYGNTGVEFPECVKFSRWLTAEWRLNFHETKLLRTDAPGYKYEAQQMIWERLIADGRIGEVLKADGKLKSTLALERACPPDLAAEIERRGLIWPAGTKKSFTWCSDQYGWPLLGKSWSRLKARRINVDTFLRFSESGSDDPKLLRYYDVLRQCKISQACCDVIKKEPSEAVQAGLGVDLVFKGLMASESRARAKNFLTRGHLFQGAKKAYLGNGRIWHCQPLATWTDTDIWEYIHRFNLPYASLYDVEYVAADGTRQTIRRNGCIPCATDMLFPNNHVAVLRRTHPKLWRSYMKRGMAREIRNLQVAMRDGQLGMLDMFTAEELVDEVPCVFDDLEGIGFMEGSDNGDDGWDPEV